MATSTSEQLPDDEVRRNRLRQLLSMGFVLDVVSLTRGDGHLVDILLLTSIVQANVAAIFRRADMNLAYAELGSAPPDSLRRPVSVNALASSLRLPFETVRRRVRKLAAQDLCRMVEGGVIVPQSVLTAPTYLTNAFAAYERLRTLYYELRDRGVLGPLPPPTVAFAEGQAPVRAVARLTSDYVLRVIDDLMTLAGGPLNGFILLGVFRGNIEHLGPDAPQRKAVAPDQPLPDVVRRPVRLSAVAARAGLPPETARRHVADLIQRGLIMKLPDGLVVPGDALGSAPIIGFIENNQANLQRLLAGLSQLGVLELWDGLRPPVAPVQAIPQNG
jgi:hypothetical protein